MSFLEEFFQDARYGLRTLRRSPGFTTVALLVLALGIGANSTVFSVIDNVVLRPLPFEKADHLVWLFEEHLQKRESHTLASPANFVDWKKQSRSFEGITAIAPRRFNLTGGDEPEQVLAMLVTADFFSVFRAQSAIGRTFLPEDFESAAAASVSMISHPGEKKTRGQIPVILSYGLWQRRFGGKRELIGSTTELEGQPATVIGVMPREFALTELPGWGRSDCWIPQTYAENENPRARYLTVIARRKSSVSMEQTQAEMGVIARQLDGKRPDSNSGWSVRVVPLQDFVVGEVRHELLVLWGAVGFVLLIACANIANLLLSRGALRQREIAVRSSLGASRLRLIRQLLTESTLLGGVAGLAGFLLAAWGIKILLALSPENLPRLNEIGIDARVFGFALALSLITGGLCGIAPALRFSKTDLSIALKEGGTTSAGRSQRWLANALVVGEIALALVLLVGAGLLLHSFSRLQALNLGFNPKNVLTFGLNLPRNKYSGTVARSKFYQDVVKQIERIPSVRWAAAGGIPLTTGAAGSVFYAEGQSEGILCGFDAPSPNYFRALHVPLLKGRFFKEDDTDGAAAVVIVNRAAAEKCWPGENPIGKRITFDDRRRDNYWMTVVGVVGNIRTAGLEIQPGPDLYLPLAQSRVVSPGNLVVRTEGDPMSLLAAVRSAVWSIDKNVPLSRIATMEERLSRATARGRFNLILIGTFSLLAFVLAAVGIYGVVAYAVTRRTHEIGVRMALGARRGDVLRLILGEGVLLLVLGEGIGLVGAFALNRMMSSMLFGITPTDPITYVTVSFSWAAITFLATYLPARRATKVDPMVALRYE